MEAFMKKTNDSALTQAKDDIQPEKSAPDRNKSDTRAVKTVAIMMGATVLSKLLGMLRGVLQTRTWGTTPEANAFTAASKLPLAIFDMFLSAVVLGCFIPVYNSLVSKNASGERDTRDADRFASVFLTFILLVCAACAVVGIFFAEPLLRLMTAGMNENDLRLAVTLTRIMFPMMIFTGAAYTLVGVLQSKGSFIAPAMISVVSNAGVVIYLAAINPLLGDKGIYGLAAAFVISWLIQLATLILPLLKVGFSFRLNFDFKDKSLHKALRMAPPIMAGSWLSPMGILLGQYFASRVALGTGLSGAATVFDCANNVYVMIAGTLTYSICNYTFPKLSRLAGNDEEGFAATIRGGIVSALFISVPFMAAALVLSGEGVSVLYRRGAFTAEDAANTAAVLRAMLPAMPFFCVTELFSRVFYSKNLVKIPMLASIAGIVSNAVAGSVLVLLGIGGVAAVGAANAVGQAVSAVVLICFASRRIPGLIDRKLIFEVLRVLTGGGLTFVTSAAISALVSSEPYTAAFVTNVLKAFVIFLPAAAVYIAFTKLTRTGLFGKNRL